jgi:hypothetical protein
MHACVQRIFALVHAPESQLHEKLGGLEAMDELIDVSSAESETKVIKFANKLSFALRSSVEYEFLLQVRDAKGGAVGWAGWGINKLK